MFFFNAFITFILILLLIFITLKARIRFDINGINTVITISLEFLYFFYIENFVIFTFINYRRSISILGKKIKFKKKKRKKKRAYLRKIIRTLKIKQLRIKLRIGCGDAFYTAIASGVILSIFIFWGKHLCEKSTVECLPIYNGQVLNIKIDGIIGL